MPLVHSASPEAFKSNLKAELAAGKPQKQALAIAYSEQRRAPRADGGEASFDTQLSPTDEAAFSTWKQRYAPRDSGQDYDLRGAFKAGLTPDQTGHWPDTYKKPNHPTFSDQSIYATGSNAAKAGRWEGEKYLPPGRANGGSAIDAALRIARATGGYTPPAAPYFERQEMQNVEKQPYGFSVGTGGGRTDKNNVSVNPGSYVLAADIVAGLGDGNSLSGAHVWDTILNSMPWGISPVRSTGHRGPPPPPHDPMLAQGLTGPQKEPTLAVGGEVTKVPIASADGEILLSDEDVLRVGQNYSPQRDLDNYPATHDKMMHRAHKILDHFQKVERGKNIRRLKSLRGPVGSKDASRGHV